MNIKNLKAIIDQLPDSMDVYLVSEQGEFTYGLLESATVKEIKFVEDENEEPTEENPTETVLVLSEG